jgi:hypothetical protein
MAQYQFQIHVWWIFGVHVGERKGLGGVRTLSFYG